MKRHPFKALHAITTMLGAIALLAVPVNAGTTIVAAGHITVDEDRLTATSNHSATISFIDPDHVFENWLIQGELEHPTPTIAASCSDSGIAGITTEIDCVAHKAYSDCNAAFGAQRGRTSSQIYVGSSRVANATKRLGTRHLECSSQCFADDTDTTIISLGDSSSYIPFKTSKLAYKLIRSRQFGGERFVMDEWAVKSSGDSDWASAPRSSSDKFRDAVTAQLGPDLPSSYLVIQEPVHEMNSRWIPHPEIRLAETWLAADRRGSGEVVAVRAEIFKDQRVEDLQVIYQSSSLDEAWIRDLVKQRVSLKFASEKQHPTVAFLVLRIGEQLEVVNSLSILPKCCHCISWPCT